MKSVKEKLKTGTASIGSWMQIVSSDVAEIMGSAGYDWVAVDLEHGAFTRDRLPDVFRAIEKAGGLPFARTADCSAASIKAALDSGAKGLILPMIESRSQLDAAIDAALYPPEGSRGVGYCRSNLFGKEFYKGLSENRDTFFCAQIEHVQALDRLDEIFRHPGLDAVMAGPYDLSGSMDVTGRFDHPDFTAAIHKIFTKAQEYDVPMGFHIVQPNPEALKSNVDEGYRFIAYGIDAVFLYNLAERPEI